MISDVIKKIPFIALLFIYSNLSAQTKGVVTGSFETNTIIYAHDNYDSYITPDHSYGSNNYLKLDWQKGAWSAGVQAEWHPIPLIGYNEAWRGFGLPEKYVSWSGENIKITLGDFYEQFGSGLIFRAWEDRKLGHNNSIGGVNISGNIKEVLSYKLIYGFPRDYLHSKSRGYKWYRSIYDNYAESNVAGGDFSLSLGKLLGLEDAHLLSLEASVLERIEWNKLDNMKENVIGFKVPDNNFSWSGRLSYYFNNFLFKGEYVAKQKDYYESSLTLKPELRAGNAVVGEVYYGIKGFSVAALFRPMDNMVNKAYRSMQPLESNILNYTPALCRQHSYVLCTLSPYYANTEGEAGGEIDVFYNIPKKSALGGRYGMKLHFNYAGYYSLRKYHPLDKNALLFRDISFDIDKKWNNRFKTILYLNIQEYSLSHGLHKMTQVQNIAVLDMEYMFTKKFAVRGELQYLYSAEGDKDWMYGLLDFSFAPKWSFNIGDMYNSGGSKVHYYMGGISFKKESVMISASYGRNREGMICSGGVCRWQPAYTGGSVSATIIF